MAKKQIGDIDYNVEFNDSVLSTKTWNNPRYDGCETKTQELNKFTTGDITYGKKTAVQKYTRNIYIGDNIISCSGSEDPNLVPFSGFSYLTSLKSLTINEDDSVIENIFNNSNTDERNGYFRSFTEDFGIGTSCKILLLNENITNTLQDEYNIYFTGGKLNKLLFFNNGTGSANSILPQIATAVVSFSKQFQYNTALEENIPGGDTNGGNITIFNNFDVNSINSSPGPGEYTSTSSMNNFLGDIQTKIEESPYNRFFITFADPRGNTKQYNSTINYSIPYNDDIKNLFVSTDIDKTPTAIATFEIQQINNPGDNLLNDIMIFSNKLTPKKGLNLLGIDYYVSKFNDNIPSILINLDKNQELPNGLLAGQYLGDVFNTDPAQRVGPKFIIIPENLHPYIKENINYFLIKAGLMEENNVLTINPKNRQLS